MFDIGKTKIPTGAKDKIEIARQMRAAGRFNVNKQSSGGEIRYPSQTIPITLIYAVATITAMVVTGGGSNPLSGMHFTGVPAVDSFVTGGDIVHFTDDPDYNKVFTFLLRGLSFCVLAGFVPAVAFLLDRLLFRKLVMPLILCWGVAAVGIMWYLCIPADSIAPFFKGIIPFIKSL